MYHRATSMEKEPRLEQRWRAHAGMIAWPTLVLFALIVGTEVWLWRAHIQGVVGTPAAVAIASVCAYTAFTVMHEAVHGNIQGQRRKLRWLAEGPGHLSSWILATPYEMFRVLHLMHHAKTNDPTMDTDMWVRGSSVPVVFARCLTIAAGYYKHIFSGETGRSLPARRARPKVLLEMTFTTSLIVGLSVAGYGQQVLWLWIVPALTAMTFLAFVFDWLPHHPHDEQTRFLDTRVVLFPGLTFPLLWQNYHLIHHLYPRVPFYRYTACFRDVRPLLQERGSPIWSWRQT
jgi:fatty acid desaturase